MTSILGLRGMSYFKSHPVDTLALTGQNVTNGNHNYSLYWKRSKTMTFPSQPYISYSITVYEQGGKRYKVTLSGCTWTLHIQNVRAIDERYYGCYFYNYMAQTPSLFEDSDVAGLTVIDPINTTVIPSHIERYVGHNATFRCQTRAIIEHKLKYTWYKNQGNSWQELSKEDTLIALTKQNKNMTMLRLTVRESGTAVKCMVFKRILSITGETTSGLLLVCQDEVTMETITGEVTTVNTSEPLTSYPTISRTEPTPKGELDRQSIISVSQTSSPLPTKILTVTTLLQDLRTLQSS